jgi:hypothetical protein
MSRLEKNEWTNSDINQGKYIHTGVIRQRVASIDSIIDMSKPVKDYGTNKCGEDSPFSKEGKKKRKQDKSHKKHKKEKRKKHRREGKSKENILLGHFNPILQLFSARIV